MIRDGSPWSEIDAAELTDEEINDLELIKELNDQGVFNPSSPNYNPGIKKRFEESPIAKLSESFMLGMGSMFQPAAINEFKEYISGLLAQMRAAIEASLPQGRAKIDDDTFDLLYYLGKELDAAQQADPRLAKYTLHDLLLLGFDDKWHSVRGGPFAPIIRKARAQAKKDREAKKEPKQKLISPARHIMPNNKWMLELAGLTGKEPINAGPYDLPVIPKKKKQQVVTTYVMAEYKPEKDISGNTSNLSPIELLSSNAVMSVWEQAQKDQVSAIFTVNSLYSAMPGAGDKPSDTQGAEIEKAIQKYSKLDIEIDATNELRERGVIGPKDKFHVRAPYLQVTEFEYSPNGKQSVKAWRIESEPIVLTYSKMTKQVLTIPMEFLAIEKMRNGRPSSIKLNMSSERKAMASQMLRRIEVMKHDEAKAREALRAYERRQKNSKTPDGRVLDISSYRKQSDTILFSNIIEHARGGNVSRQQLSIDRNFCLECLDFWKARGYINGYRVNKKGKAIVSVTILHK